MALPGGRLASGPFHQTFLGDDSARGVLTLPPPRCAASVGPRPSANVRRSPEIASGPAVDRDREVWLTAELVSSLFAHAEHLGDLNDSKELSSPHNQQYAPGAPQLDRFSGPAEVVRSRSDAGAWPHRQSQQEPQSERPDT